MKELKLVYGRPNGTSASSFNRTMKELKPQKVFAVTARVYAFNRTMKELKLGAEGGIDFVFASFNRTMKELKLRDGEEWLEEHPDF